MLGFTRSFRDSPSTASFTIDCRSCVWMMAASMGPLSRGLFYYWLGGKRKKMLWSSGGEQFASTLCWFWTLHADHVINTSHAKAKSLIGWCDASSLPKFKFSNSQGAQIGPWCSNRTAVRLTFHARRSYPAERALIVTVHLPTIEIIRLCANFCVIAALDRFLSKM